MSVYNGAELTLSTGHGCSIPQLSALSVTERATFTARGSVTPCVQLHCGVCCCCCRMYRHVNTKHLCMCVHDLYSSPNILRVIKSRRMRWAGHVARMGGGEGVYRVLLGKPEGRRPLGRRRCRWVDNIRMDLQEVGCGYMDWIGLAQDRDRWRTFVSAVMNLRVP